MAKKTANHAIDFERLFAVKAQLARQDEANEAVLALERTVVEHAEPALAPPCETAPHAVPSLGETSATMANVIDFPTPAIEVDKPVRAAGVGPEAAPTPGDEDVLLRIGLSRPLHERLRAFAALEGKSPTILARELLDSNTPVLDRAAPMVALAKAARGAFAVSAAERRRVDVRMQIPVGAALHRRLHQVAALRTQTLGACVIDVFEAAVPAM